MNDEKLLLTEDAQSEEILQVENSLVEPSEEITIPEEDAVQAVPAEISDEEQTAVEVPLEKEELKKEEVQQTEEKAVPYHERYYLRYNEGKRSTELDLNGTLGFLQGLGFDGGELYQARNGKGCSDDLVSVEKSNNKTYCSYCGTEISGVEFFRMPDGRKRCTNCSNTVVKSKTEVEEILQRIINNMDAFFGATIDVPVDIKIVEERKLKKKIGVPLGQVDDQSILILGVAVNKKGKYSVILENGAPRISLIATFVHELTHIWQYTHWDNQKNFKKCSKNNELLIYEGMAKWVEIQYLYLIGETNVARREEAITRSRDDEYGKGFCMYEEAYPLTREAMACADTPFITGEYPL